MSGRIDLAGQYARGGDGAIRDKVMRLFLWKDKYEFPVAVGHVEVCGKWALLWLESLKSQFWHEKFMPNCEEIGLLEVDDEAELRTGLRRKKRRACPFWRYVGVRHRAGDMINDEVLNERFLSLGVLAHANFIGVGIEFQLDVMRWENDCWSRRKRCTKDVHMVVQNSFKVRPVDVRLAIVTNVCLDILADLSNVSERIHNDLIQHRWDRASVVLSGSGLIVDPRTIRCGAIAVCHCLLKRVVVCTPGSRMMDGCWFGML